MVLEDGCVGVRLGGRGKKEERARIVLSNSQIHKI